MKLKNLAFITLALAVIDSTTMAKITIKVEYHIYIPSNEFVKKIVMESNVSKTTLIDQTKIVIDDDATVKEFANTIIKEALSKIQNLGYKSIYYITIKWGKGWLDTLVTFDENGASLGTYFSKNLNKPFKQVMRLNEYPDVILSVALSEKLGPKNPYIQ